MQVESLEDRTLLTTWADIANLYNSYVPTIRGLIPNAVDSTFRVQVPLVQSSLAPLFDPVGKLLAAFPSADVFQPDPSWTIDQACAQLANHFAVNYCSLTPRSDDGSNDVLRLTADLPSGVTPAPLDLGGFGDTLGFDYFKTHTNGSLSGSLMPTVQPVTGHVMFGVDVVNGIPQFFVADHSGLTEPGITGTGLVQGTMNIGNLLNVGISGSATLSLSAALNWHRPDGQKLRPTDLADPNNVTGGFTGSLNFPNVTLHAQATTFLPMLSWTGTWGATVSSPDPQHRNHVQTAATVLNTPSPLRFVQGLASSLFSIGGSFNILRSIQAGLNYWIPLLNKTIGQVLNVPADLLNWGSLPNLGTTVASIQSALNPLGIYLGTRADPITDANLASRLQQVIEGQRVDLLSFSISGGTSWGAGIHIPLIEVGVPGLLDLNIGVDLGGSIGWSYSVGLGIDTTGFYIDPSTHVGVTGEVHAGISGNLEVLGFNLASASGRLELDANAGVSLRNPDASQGNRIYLDQILSGGLLQTFLNDIQASFTVGLVAHLEAKINLWIASITVFSHDWDLGRLVDLYEPLVTTVTQRSLPLNLVDLVLNVQPVNGVLTLDGSGDATGDLVALSQEVDGSVDVNWLGKGKHRYDSGTVHQIRFIGGAGNNRLQATPGFDVPIYAQAGSGNDYLEDGDGGGTLIGGAGQDTLVGGAGTNHLTAGSGNTLLQAGSGDSTLTGGAGSDTLYGGAGRDLLQGGGGATVIYAGSGNSTLIGGMGNATLYGGAGNDLLIGGTTASATDPSNGNDLILGAAAVRLSGQPAAATP